MRGNRDEAFSLSGFLSTPRMSVEEWPDTLIGESAREMVKDNFRQLFSPETTFSFDKFPVQGENCVFSSNEPQLVPEWFPFEENSPNNATNWVNWQQSSKNEGSTTSFSSLSHTSQQNPKQSASSGEGDKHFPSWSFQRPTFSPCPGSNVNCGRQVDPEKAFLMKEFKKKIREAAVFRFRQKRRERNFANVVRYDCRKRVADARPRFKGRFVKVQKEQPSSVHCSDNKSVSKRASVEGKNDEDFQVVPYLVE